MWELQKISGGGRGIYKIHGTPNRAAHRVYEFILKFENSIIPHLCDTTNKQSTKLSDGIDGAKKYTMTSSNQWRFRDDNNNMHFEPQFGTEFNRFLQGH